MNAIRITTILTLLLLIGRTLSWGQGVTLDGSPDNKWVLHNPNDSRKTLYIAPWNNNTWDWNVASQFRSNGDMLILGQLGIGIVNSASPTSSLDVRGISPVVRIGASTTQNAQHNTVIGSLEFPTSSETAWMAKIKGNVGDFADQPYLTFHTGSIGAEQMRISQSGNIGIGSVDPVSKLHIKGGGLTLGSNVMSTNTDGFVSLGDLNTNSSPTPQDWTAKTSLLLNALDYSTIGFHDSGSRVDFIRSGGGKIDLGYDGGWGRAHVGFANGIWDANGKVGIGTLTPTALLHVNGNYRSEGSFSQGWPGTFAVDATGVIGGRFVILDNGNVGIGTPAPGNYKLAVEGKIGAREVEVKVGSWADFVFQPGYRLRPLSEVERYLQTYKHLPEIPSEAEVKTNGINLGEMDAKLLQKIEELTLYSIQLEKSMQVQEQKHQQDLLRLQQVQQTEIDELKRLVKQLLDKK